MWQANEVIGPMPVLVDHNHDLAVGKARLYRNGDGTGTVIVEMSEGHVQSIMERMADSYQVVAVSFVYIKTAKET